MAEYLLVQLCVYFYLSFVYLPPICLSIYHFIYLAVCLNLSSSTLLKIFVGLYFYSFFRPLSVSAHGHDPLSAPPPSGIHLPRPPPRLPHNTRAPAHPRGHQVTFYRHEFLRHMNPPVGVGPGRGTGGQGGEGKGGRPSSSEHRLDFFRLAQHRFALTCFFNWWPRRVRRRPAASAWVTAARRGLGRGGEESGCDGRVCVAAEGVRGNGAGGGSVADN